MGILCLSIFFVFYKYIFGAGSCYYCCPPLCAGGIVPCGRSCDDPNTQIVEAVPCTLCHFFVLLKRIVDFSLGKIAFPLATLILTIGGLTMLVSAGNLQNISRGREIIISAVIGLLVMFIAWLGINTILCVLVFGHLPNSSEIATVFGNPWNKIDCPVTESSEFSCCGDGIVQQPNFYGVNEECERNESFDDFKARGNVNDLNDDGVVDMVDYTIMKYVCDNNCTLKCLDDPLFSEVGKGCYLPGVECQKGKYACNFDVGRIECYDVYTDPMWGGVAGGEIYDYCCRATEDSSYSFSDAQNALRAIEWVKVKPYAASHGTKKAEADGYPGEYRCDEICRSMGKICIGTIIDKNDITTACYGIRCHDGDNCVLDANMERIDCRLTYPFTKKDGSSSKKCTNPETYYVGYTSCICK